MIARIAALALLPAFAMADLKVHEWGTFTTLSDSTGTVLRWYSPQSEHSALPKFVKMDPMFMKNGMLSTVRMETPVIYFYPDKPMEVSVEAWFKDGGITELYPYKAPMLPNQTFSVSPSGFMTMPTRWKGRLLPPTDKEALRMIPAVSSDERGAHYAAARNVPEAWIFHHRAQVMDPETKKMIPEDQADKFIFYRGAGNFAQGLTFKSPAENEIQISNTSQHAYPNGVMLQVKNGRARWSKMPGVAASKEEPVMIPTHITGKWQPVEEAEKELTAWFQATLTSEGLTRDEAAAMIATWHGTWFRESGLRVFTLMPRQEVDEILPLKVKPVPSSLVRVFVSRHELLTTAQEEELATLIHDPRISNQDARKRLDKLELGRFQNATMGRALEIGRTRMHLRYQEILSEECAKCSP